MFYSDYLACKAQPKLKMPLLATHEAAIGSVRLSEWLLARHHVVEVLNVLLILLPSLE